MHDLAIVIPAFLQSAEQAMWLAEAIESAINAAGPAREVIVVDDASPTWLANSAFTGVRFLKHDHRLGAGAARNTGIAATTAPYILCLDADDKLRRDGLHRLWEARCPKGVVYGDLEYIGERSGFHQLPEWNLEMLIRGAGPLPVTALQPREAWRAVGGFDETLPGLEDIDYWVKLAARGYCGMRVPHVIFEYRRHGLSRQSALEADDKRRMRQVHEVMRHRYRKVLSEMATIQRNCSRCPGSGGLGTGVDSMIPEEVGSETARLRYVGPLQGSFRAHGFMTGAKYFIDGRGTTITVDVRDAPALLQRHSAGRPDFERIEDVVIESVGPVSASFAPLAATPIDNPPSTLAQITALNVKDATALIEVTEDLPDLSVWLAEERASEKPRKTLIFVLEARIAEVSAGVAARAGQDG